MKVNKRDTAEPTQLYVLTLEQWLEEGLKRFGRDANRWKFVCPSCGHIASVADWRNSGALEGAVAFSCVGRWMSLGKAAERAAFRRAGGPCNYAGGGLIGLNPVQVMKDGVIHRLFEFAKGEKT